MMETIKNINKEEGFIEVESTATRKISKGALMQEKDYLERKLAEVNAMLEALK